MAVVYSFDGESREAFLGRCGLPLVVAYMVSSPGTDCAAARTFATRPEARQWVLANLKQGGALHSRIQALFPRGDQIAFDSEVLDELRKVLDYTYVSHMDCGTIDIFAMRPISRRHSSMASDGTEDTAAANAAAMPTSVYWHVLAEDTPTPAVPALSVPVPMSPSPSPVPAPVEFSGSLASIVRMAAPVPKPASPLSAEPPAPVLSPSEPSASAEPPSSPASPSEPSASAEPPAAPPVLSHSEPSASASPSELLVAVLGGSTDEATRLYRKHGKDLEYMRATFAAATPEEVSQLKGFIRNCFELAMDDRQKANKAFHKMMKQYDISVLSEE